MKPAPAAWNADEPLVLPLNIEFAEIELITRAAERYPTT
jgi:hypothetical protein